MDNFNQENISTTNIVDDQTISADTDTKIILDTVSGSVLGSRLVMRGLEFNGQQQQLNSIDENNANDTDNSENSANTDAEWTFLSRDAIHTSQINPGECQDTSKSQILIAEALNETEIDSIKHKNVKRQIDDNHVYDEERGECSDVSDDYDDDDNMYRDQNEDEIYDKEDDNHPKDDNEEDSDDANWTDTDSVASSAEMVEMENQITKITLTDVNQRASAACTDNSGTDLTSIDNVNDRKKQSITSRKQLANLEYQSSSSFSEQIQTRGDPKCEKYRERLHKIFGASSLEKNITTAKGSLPPIRLLAYPDSSVDQLSQRTTNEKLSFSAHQKKKNSEGITLLLETLKISDAFIKSAVILAASTTFVLIYVCLCVFLLLPPSKTSTKLGSHQESAVAKNEALWQSLSNILNATGIKSPDSKEKGKLGIHEMESIIIRQIVQLQSNIDRYSKVYGDIDQMEQTQHDSFGQQCYQDYQKIKNSLSLYLKPIFNAVVDSSSSIVNSIDSHVTKPMEEYVLPAAKTVHNKLQETVVLMDEKLEKAAEILVGGSFSTLETAYDKVIKFTSDSISKDNESWLNIFTV